jgi:hypothetical protein
VTGGAVSEMVSTSAPCDPPGHCWAAELERDTKRCRLSRLVSVQLVFMPPPLRRAASSNV